MHIWGSSLADQIRDYEQGSTVTGFNILAGESNTGSTLGRKRFAYFTLIPLRRHCRRCQGIQVGKRGLVIPLVRVSSMDEEDNQSPNLSCHSHCTNSSQIDSHYYGQLRTEQRTPPDFALSTIASSRKPSRTWTAGLESRTGGRWFYQCAVTPGDRVSEHLPAHSHQREDGSQCRAAGTSPAAFSSLHSFQGGTSTDGD